MHRFAVFAAMAAVFLAATATADAAPRKKAGAKAERSVALKHKRHHVAPPARGPWNQPWQSNQGWPTSYNDGSFSYGIGPGRDRF